MHLNYHFFKHLGAPLQKKLVGKQLLACFSQEKDELVLGFGDSSGDFYIRVSVLGSFSGLYFTTDFKRAKKNSVDLFQGFIHSEVEDLYLFENERAIEIKLSGEKAILLKMFGNRSNVLGLINDSVIEVFNNKLPDDRKIIPAQLNRTVIQTFEEFKNADCQPKSLFPTWGKLPLMFFENKKTGVCEMDWKIVEQISEELNRSKFYIIRINDRLHLSLIPIGDIVKSFEDPIAANNFFFIENLKTAQLSSEQNRAVKQLQKRIEQTESYLVETEKSLAKLKNGISNQQIGHILMANLYRIPTNAEYVELNDFETGELISIKLKKTLSAQKNAEIFYRKSKNEKLEIEFLEKNITVKQSLLNELRQKLEETEKVESLRDFRAFIKTELPKESKKRPPKPEELFKCFEKNGFRIWVGRNAKNNDVLTLKYADKNDTWLHAKDVSGSHVVIKQIPGSKIPKDVLEYAAELAAYYSKRRTDSLVPVAYTLKKNVRKIKGSPDGQVFVEKENSILVKPLADPA